MQCEPSSQHVSRRRKGKRKRARESIARALDAEWAREDGESWGRESKRRARTDQALRRAEGGWVVRGGGGGGCDGDWVAGACPSHALRPKRAWPRERLRQGRWTRLETGAALGPGVADRHARCLHLAIESSALLTMPLEAISPLCLRPATNLCLPVPPRCLGQRSIEPPDITTT